MLLMIVLQALSKSFLRAIVLAMQTTGFILDFAISHAITLGGFGLLLGSLASVLVVFLIHTASSKGKAFDAAVDEALRSHQSRPHHAEVLSF